MNVLRTVFLAASILLLASLANAAWSDVQAANARRETPNDFWYNHRIVDGTFPVTDYSAQVTADPNHSYQWYFGDNYLNLERAWAIVKGEDSNVLIASNDTEFLWWHPDLIDSLIPVSAEANGQPGIDDDGDGAIDNLYRMHAFTSGMGRAGAGAPWDTQVDDSVETQHGTNMISQAIAMTDNESWWEAPSSLSPDISEGRYPGIAGITWGCGFVPLRFSETGRKTDDALYVMRLIESGYNIKVMSCSWTDQPREFIDILNDAGVLVVTGSGNGAGDDWQVQAGATNEKVIVAGAISSTYEFSMWGTDSGTSYMYDTDNKMEKKIDVNAYAPNEVGLFKWSEPYGFNIFEHPTSTHIPALTLGYVESQGEAWAETEDGLAFRYLTQMGCDLTEGYDFSEATATNKVTVPVIMHSKLQTSGATSQAAGVAALCFTLWGDLEPAQVKYAMMRGSVPVNTENAGDCCTGEDYEDCYTWVPPDPPAAGYWDRNDAVWINDCDDYLGRGRLDAYRTLTLWGAVSDTTLSGDVYVSGDVEFRGTVNIDAGTRFFIAPDDITHLDPWDATAVHNMGTGVVTAQFQTSGSEDIIELMVYLGATLNINGTVENPVVFDSFVEGAQGTDWFGIRNLFGAGTVNGSNYSILHAVHSTVQTP